ncbi:hypothetical protein J7T55_007630 [Diaporthe amygdali]|uniref:uncharacterized protein n=1 Tax=Phomopsis amygdali TaxID=1214568 RepID=UPI0022FF0653|nr:uncharacterized protein J7T55_007630 [Diaporthe amygdali]KAJ0107260.1 hypothetical protein J7T55_007630 [Diaporthe amygdali]
MPLDIEILPRRAAVNLARTTERKPSQTNTVELHVFCDGSFKRGRKSRAGIGIVVNIWLPREHAKRRTSKACFIPFCPPGGNHRIEAFALAEGAYVAVDQIFSLMTQNLIVSTDKFEIIFWSDSKRVLGSLETPRRYAVLARKMEHILHIIELKARDLQDLRSVVSLKFRWCPGECVEPHKTADHLSKKVRDSGGRTPSKALDLFKRLPHSAIESALRRQRDPPSPTPPTSPSSHLLQESSNMTDKAISLVPDTYIVLEDVKSKANIPDALPSSPIAPPAPPPTPNLSAAEPVASHILHRAAVSSRFFSIIAGTVTCLPSHQRSDMRHAIRQQKEANKKWQTVGLTLPEDPKEDNPLGYSRNPNPFAIIQAAALELPDSEKEDLLAAIDLQKKKNAHIAETRALGEGYESHIREESEMGDEPEVIEAPRQGRLKTVWHWVERKLTGL